MIQSTALWFRGRSRREQRLLLVMLALLILVFAWLLVVRPLSDSLSGARERHGEAVVALAEAKAGAATIERLEKTRPAASGGSLEMLIQQAAAESGFQLSRIQPEGDGGVTIALDAARPQAFFAWVTFMETKKGLIVRQLTATSNSDRTLAAQVTVHRRSGP